MRAAVAIVPVLAACASAPVVNVPCPVARTPPASRPPDMEVDAFDADESTTVARGFAIESSAVQSVLELTGDRCIELSLAVTRGIVDGDLAVFSREGVRLAYDDAADRFARVRVCVAGPTSVVVRATAGRGAGDVAIRVGAVTDAALAATAIHDGREAGRQLAVLIAPSLEERGYRVAPAREALRIEPGVPLRVPLAPSPGSCVAIVARGSHELALAILDASDRVLAQDVGASHELRVERCVSESETPAAIELRSTEGDLVELVVANAEASRIGGDAGTGGSR